MKRIVVCGIGTDVGKTLVSAILVQALQAHYWKPIQAGNLEASDSQRVQELVQGATCYPEVYRLIHPLSPHHAAALNQMTIDSTSIKIPLCPCPLIIEPAGGVLVPINQKELMIDLLLQWDCDWILVSRHYVGSINHTLLTLEALKARKVRLKGIIFNGIDQQGAEQFLLSHSGLTVLGHLESEINWNPSVIQRYAHLWKPHL